MDDQACAYGAAAFLALSVTQRHLVASDALGNLWMLEAPWLV